MTKKELLKLLDWKVKMLDGKSQSVHFLDVDKETYHAFVSVGVPELKKTNLANYKELGVGKVFAYKGWTLLLRRV